MNRNGGRVQKDLRYRTYGLEMNILNWLKSIKDGGGWIESWTEDYHSGHRGLIGSALEVDDIDAIYQKLIRRIFEYQCQNL